MKPASFAVAALVSAWMASAQDLPPGVLLLSRVENHIKAEFQHLASVSCLETAQRELGQPKGKLRPLDTVRLEVISNGDQELFASPGGTKFSAQQPLSFAGSGMLGNGLFGLYLKNILLNGNATTQYKGEEDLAGSRLARYDYQLDPTFSGQTIELPEGSGSVGLKGSFWVDPRNYDVMRLELNADEIPPNLPISALTTSINYGRTILNNQLTVLLPEMAEVHLLKRSGQISHDQVEFTHCRVFGAESTIDFNASAGEPQAGFGAVSLDDTVRQLSGGLQVTVKLRSRVSIDTTVGTLIDGVVAEDVKDKHAVVIPAGSPVRGRIRRMERYAGPFAYFVVGIEFTEVEVGGIRHIFYADLVNIDPAPGVGLTLSTGDNGAEAPRNQLSAPGTAITVTKERIVVHNLPGVATFFFRGDTLDLPQNFRTVWKTRTLQ
ncbi:MAG TPA: hypothetical protein VK708_22015 [Bryobacteraceae bacterium]|nr:hypothetical protein [Bryobacteraceae bacterium]